MIEIDEPVNIHTMKKETEDDRMIRNKSKEEENEQVESVPNGNFE